MVCADCQKEVESKRAKKSRHKTKQTNKQSFEYNKNRNRKTEFGKIEP